MLARRSGKREFRDWPAARVRYWGPLNHGRGGGRYRRETLHCNELITDNKDSHLLLSLNRERLLTSKLEIFIFIIAKA